MGGKKIKIFGTSHCIKEMDTCVKEIKKQRKLRTTFLGSFQLYKGTKKASIYTVASLLIKKGLEHSSDSRTWGYFLNFKDAKRAVKMNSGDMHETTYTHVIIEKVDVGICSIAKQMAWYRWKSHRVYRRGKWIRCKAPEWAKHTINFTMG